MTQLFFHIRGNYKGVSRDEIGLDFPDVETAYLEAYRAAADIWHELAAQGQDPEDYAFETTNVSDEVVF